MDRYRFIYRKMVGVAHRRTREELTVPQATAAAIDRMAGELVCALDKTLYHPIDPPRPPDRVALPSTSSALRVYEDGGEKCPVGPARRTLSLYLEGIDLINCINRCPGDEQCPPSIYILSCVPHIPRVIRPEAALLIA